MANRQFTAVEVLREVQDDNNSDDFETDNDDVDDDVDSDDQENAGVNRVLTDLLEAADISDEDEEDDEIQSTHDTDRN